MRYGIHIDYFGGALGDLPKKLHGSDEAVLAVLAEHPVFSDFDVGTRKLGATLDRLKNGGRLEFIDDAGYPWYRVRVLPPPTQCAACGGMGGVRLIGRHFLVCQPCAGNGWIPAPASTQPAPEQGGEPT